MPIIDVKVMEKVLSPAQKALIATKITDAFAEVAGESARAVTWIVIQDVGSGQWTMGGQPVTTEGVKQLLASG
jgi:4-oxalocrotonate tautomerase